MMAVFYRHASFQVLDSGHFWLSDTPQVAGSKTWGNHYPRMATWVQFKNKSNGHIFYFLNTHLDHEIEEARVSGAKKLAHYINMWSKGYDIFVTGDFNCEIGTSAAYQILRNEAQLCDAVQDADEVVNGEYGTFHDYAGGSAAEMIDWILYRGAISSLRSEVILLQKDGQYPSDHYPNRPACRHRRFPGRRRHPRPRQRSRTAMSARKFRYRAWCQATAFVTIYL